MAPYSKEPLSKVQVVALSHYLRKDIQLAMFDFCKNREAVANHNNKFFSKRPDTFDYPSDIGNAAKQGATSFHCSEEIWDNPLDINTDMTPEQYNSIRTGWDLLIDIDSPFLDYGKIAAKLLIKEFERHGIKSYGIKFSGSRGFHMIVPCSAFPKFIGEQETKDMFPEWPRALAGYLQDRIRKPMNEAILRLSTREVLRDKGELTSKSLCPTCKSETIEKNVGKYICKDIRCKSTVESMKSNRKEMICPSCNGKMERMSERKISFCENCKINTAKIEASTSSYGGERREARKIEFETEDTIKSTEDSVDLQLAVSRHLFRTPYSLHEKTAFASIVIEPEDIEDFKPSDANPLKIKEPKLFGKEPVPGEARELLVNAIEWANENKPKERTKKWEGDSIDLSGLTITEDMFPPIVKTILKGIKADGRKRALSLLLSFYTSLEYPQSYIEEKIEEWNKKNYHPLKFGYVKSQVMWHVKNKRLPPNYGNQVYKLFGINRPPIEGLKNPINYTIKLAMKAKAKVNSSNNKPKNNSKEKFQKK